MILDYFKLSSRVTDDWIAEYKPTECNLSTNLVWRQVKKKNCNELSFFFFALTKAFKILLLELRHRLLIYSFFKVNHVEHHIKTMENHRIKILSNFLGTKTYNQVSTYRGFYLSFESFKRFKIAYSKTSISSVHRRVTLVNFGPSIAANHWLLKENEAFFNERHKISEYMPNCPAGWV